MTITTTNLEAGLNALNLPKATAEKRKTDARDHFRTSVSDKGVKPEVALRQSLEIALKGITSNRDARLRSAKNAAGITIAAKTHSVSAAVSQRLPKRSQKTHTKKADAHWSHSDLKLGAFLALFWGVAVVLLLLLVPVVYSAYNAQYGVGAGTGASFGLVLGMCIITFLVNVGFRVKFNRDYPRPDLPLASTGDLKAVGIK